MEQRRNAFGPVGAYDVQVDTVDGRPVVRATCAHPHTGMRVTLTFPAGAAPDLGRFKERVVRLVLSRIDKRQGTA